jgi:hypothetical protein
MKSNDEKVLCTIRNHDVALETVKAFTAATRVPCYLLPSEGRRQFLLVPHKAVTKAERLALSKVAVALRELAKYRSGTQNDSLNSIDLKFVGYVTNG